MTQGILLAIGAAITWGLVYVLEQRVLGEFSVMKFLFFESIFMLIVSLLSILFFENIGSLTTSKNFKVIFAPSFLLLIAITFLADYLILRSVQLAGATFASVFEVTFPLFVAIFAFFILHQSIHWMTLLGALLIISGSMLVIYVNQL